jgi:hypothetical protein
MMLVSVCPKIANKSLIPMGYSGTRIARHSSTVPANFPKNTCPRLVGYVVRGHGLAGKRVGRRFLRVKVERARRSLVEEFAAYVAKEFVDGGRDESHDVCDPLEGFELRRGDPVAWQVRIVVHADTVGEDDVFAAVSFMDVVVPYQC